MKADPGVPTVVRTGEGRTFPRPDTGGAVTIKLARETTGGAITVWESHRAAGDTRGPGLHSHPGFDEMFYVLAGEYAFRAAGRRFTAPAGTCVFIPRGMFHTFSSTGVSDGRLLSLAVPGGVEDFFEESEFATDASRARVVGSKHGVLFAGRPAGGRRPEPRQTT
jgi:mannose-6-phosphate isomerase-like protein (cupin superfamily)